MSELHLRYLGQGRFIGVSRVDKEIADEMASPGAVLVMRAANKRSHPQNQRFHAIIEAAYDHCLDDRYPSWRHLKAYVLCAVGHCVEHRISMPGMPHSVVKNIVGAVAAVIKTVSHSTVTAYDPKTHEMVIRVAKSVSFASVGAKRFSEISDKSVDYICTKICPGMQPEELKRHAKEAS